MRNYDNDKANPFANGDSPSITDVDQSIYGEVDVPSSGRVVAKPLPLAEIWPDLRQPRRAIPLAVRGQWDGDPRDVQAVLSMWHKQAEQYTGETINATHWVMSNGDGRDVDPDANPVLAEYVELLQLAASILQNGLANPISVVKRGGAYVVETGERRLLAHHLLSMYADANKYSRVPAIIKDKADTWRQAAENGARRPLNAIGMARQLALLIMDMYDKDNGVDFGTYEDVVLPGEVDRKYYAQVANGNSYQIKRGMGQRILDVTGLKNRQTLSLYRKLLAMYDLPSHIADRVWLKADLESWTENKVRTHAETIFALSDYGLPEHAIPIDDAEEAAETLEEVLADMRRSTYPTPDNGPKTGDMSRIHDISRQNGRVEPEFPSFDKGVMFGGRTAQRPSTPMQRADEAGLVPTSQGRGEQPPMKMGPDTPEHLRVWVHRPDPDEMEPGEVWTWEDELEAIEAHELMASWDDETPVLSTAPYMQGRPEVATLKHLRTLAEALNDKYAVNCINDVLSYSPDTIREMVYIDMNKFDGISDHWYQGVYQMLNNLMAMYEGIMVEFKDLGAQIHEEHGIK